MRHYRAAFLLLLSYLLTACASAPDVKDMVVDTETAKSHAYSNDLHNRVIVTNVGGGEKTNPLWTSEVNADGFKSALVESLKAAGLLQAQANAAGYQLSAEILSVDQPVFGVDMTVTAAVEYTLKNMGSGKQIFNQTLTSKHTATMGDAFYGPERLKIANEGAVKGNIQMLLEELSKLRTPSR